MIPLSHDCGCCLRADTSLNLIEARIEKAMELIDRGQREFDNLFIAYCEQQRKGGAA